MKLTEFQDFVFIPKVYMIQDSGVFVGTQNYLFCFPSKKIDHKWNRSITTISFSYDGMTVDQAVARLVNESNSIGDLEAALLDLVEAFPEMDYYRITDLKQFKVQAGLMGSGIHIQKEGDRLITPFIQALGKQKKQVKAFYENHPKHL